MGAAGIVASTGFQLISLLGEAAHSEREAEFNEKVARQAGQDAVRRGQAEAGQQRLRASRMLGQQKVALAASGVDASVGTPADVMADSARMAELDALTIENNAAREAWGIQHKADEIRRQKKLDQHKYAMQAGGTALSGFASFTDMAGGL